MPTIEVQIRAEDGTVLGPNEPGELFVRGEQVSGRYTGIGSVLDEQGRFPTKDVAHHDADGSCSSAAAPTTRSFAGARTLPRRNRGRARRASARARLRGSRTPDRVVFRDAVPTNATGKVLRRELDREFNEATKEPA